MLIAPETLLQPRSWAETTFGQVQLGDPRRTRCAVQGERDLELEATKTSKARTAHLAISSGVVRLLPPRQQKETDRRPIVVYVVRVWEPEPPEVVAGLAWLLLTSVPVQSVEQAWEHVDWY